MSSDDKPTVEVGTPEAGASRIGSSGGYLQKGTPAYRRASAILFIAGFSTFATLYCVQPLMPQFVHDFGVTPAESSLALSLSTAALGVMMLFAAMLSDQFGRKVMMVGSLLLSGGLGILSGLTPDWHALLLVRTLEGVALSGLPAVAMAYVAEEVDPRSAGVAMGLYIGGTALGGMSGRVLTAVVADLANWRAAMVVVGITGLVAAVAVWLGLPASRNFARSPAGLRAIGKAMVRHLSDRHLLALFAIGFLSMGGFVTIYNYLGFRLHEPPFDLRQAVVGAVFLVYVLGMVSSPLFGAKAGKWGGGRVMAGGLCLMTLGLALMSPDSLPLIALGIAIFTFAFFGVHSVASAWVGRLATVNRGQATALYLFSYYMGSTLAGTIGGIFWDGFGWTGVELLVAVLIALNLLLALWLMRRG